MADSSPTFAVPYFSAKVKARRSSTPHGRCPSPFSSLPKPLRCSSPSEWLSDSRGQGRGQQLPAWQPTAAQVAAIKVASHDGQGLWIRAEQDRRKGVGSLGIRPREEPVSGVPVRTMILIGAYSRVVQHA